MIESNDLFTEADDGTAEIDKLHVRTNAIFKSILTRDKGSEGDADGRKKAFAYKEFLYIYHVSSPKSIYRDLPTEARKIRAKLTAKLPDTWKEDDLVEAACKEYVRCLKLGSAAHAYYNASKAVYSIGEDLKFFNERKIKLKKQIEQKTLLLDNTSVEEDRQKYNADIERNITGLMNLTKNIMGLSSQLEEAYTSLEKLKERMAKEQGKKQEIHGGGKLGRREE